MTDSKWTEVGRWYPAMPPALPDETDDQYTDRLTGADGTGRVPYDHKRYRQCSLSYHEECSRLRTGDEGCQCPCHDEIQQLVDELPVDWLGTGSSSEAADAEAEAWGRRWDAAMTRRGR